MENYHQESFGVSKKAKVDNSTLPKIPSPTVSSPRVVFQESQKTITCQPEDSILDVAQKEGVKIRAGCRQGVCGACKKRKISGSVRYEATPEGLEPQEQDYILPCIAFPVGEVVIEA